MRRCGPLLLAFLLVACGGGGGSTPTTTTETTVRPTTTTTEGEPPPDLEASIREAIDGGALCPDAPEVVQVVNTVEVQEFDDDQWLVSVVCETYAYQLGYQFAIWDGESLEPVEAPWFDTTTERIQIFPTVSGFASLSADGISVLTKYRGAGDCGAVAHYEIRTPVGDDDERHELVLVRFQERTCGEASRDDPTDTDTWPTVYEGT